MFHTHTFQMIYYIADIKFITAVFNISLSAWEVRINMSFCSLISLPRAHGWTRIQQ